MSGFLGLERCGPDSMSTVIPDGSRPTLRISRRSSKIATATWLAGPELIAVHDGVQKGSPGAHDVSVVASGQPWFSGNALRFPGLWRDSSVVILIGIPLHPASEASRRYRSAPLSLQSAGGWRTTVRFRRQDRLLVDSRHRLTRRASHIQAACNPAGVVRIRLSIGTSMSE